jgi:hypothetical protein
MKVINLFAGPGCGKSTLAAGIFSLLKFHGVLVELVTIKVMFGLIKGTECFVWPEK